MNFGGTSIGGIAPNRKFWSASLIPGVDYLPHTHDLKRNAFSRGEPEHGIELADELERLVAFHDASTIAAVIVEPIAGSTGVLIPPKGYLKRIREICDKHKLLLIFDEVITGFGRTGSAFARAGIRRHAGHHHLREGSHQRLRADGLRHRQARRSTTRSCRGRTASSCSTATRTARIPRPARPASRRSAIYETEGLLTRAKSMARYWEDAAHALKGAPHLIDIRNYGLIGALEFEPIPGKPGARAFEVYLKCFEKGLLVRQTGDIIALSPPLIIERAQIDQIFGTLAEVLKTHLGQARKSK